MIMCIHITSFNHHVTVVIATCTYDYIYCICIYIYALQFVDMDVENEKMYGCTMVVGPVTFVSFGGLSVHVGSTLASGTKKTPFASTSISVKGRVYTIIYICVCVFWGVESPHFCWYQKMMPHWQKSSVLGVGSISVATSSAAALPFSPC